MPLQSIKAESFHPSAFPLEGKYAFDLETGVPGVPLPVLLVRGRAPGKRLVATASVHGDEYEGVRAIMDVFRALDPARMSGDLLAVTVANPPAFWAGSRTNPMDDLNLARVFPGNPLGRPTEIFAHHLARSIIAYADLFIDFHSAGVKWLMPGMAGYDAADPRSLAAARAFGPPIIWGHPTLTEGRTISFAASLGIPWLYTEARGAGRIHPADLEMMTRGLFNVLKHLGILPGAPSPAPLERHLFGDGNVDHGLAASQPGFFVPFVELLQRVEFGHVLGELRNLHAETLEVYRAPRAGIVALLRQFPVVELGEALFLLADEWKEV